ncbi:MAG: riboflavin synthase, alpha subunit [Frankiales bacterium]|nr:riboflavin synthase, alpha subunit [Frankiales bacterium]
MFTGIVEELGQVIAWAELPDAARVTVRGPLVTSDAGAGDSIAVNGVCLTVVDVSDGSFTADVMKETLVRSALGALTVGSAVNLERAVRVQDRLGGHLVQGHVDGTGEIVSVEPGSHWTVVTVSMPAELGRYVVEKGSITVDGVSLTLSAVDHTEFQVSLIPTTLEHTTLGRKAVGDAVNLEVDITAKYVEKLLAAGAVPGAPAASRGDA